MAMEPDADKFVPALTLGRAGVDWGRRLADLALLGLTPLLFLWNLLLLVLLFQSMPQNDLGRPLLSTQAFLAGKDMYALNEVVVYHFNRDTVIHLWNLNPPHSHLLYLPLTVMPPGLALLVWCVLSGLCLYGSIRIIVSEIGIALTPRRMEWMALGLLAFTGTGAALITAHVSFLLMLAITLSWRDARHGRWGQAGAWLGLALSIKPFLLIFVPYLVLKRCWRGIASMGLTVGLAFLLGLLVFGPANHHSWLRVLSQADSWAWLPLNASLYGTLNRVLMKNPAFTPMLALRAGRRPGGLARPGEPRGPGGATPDRDGFFEFEHRPGLRDPSGQWRCSSRPWDGSTISGCPWARLRRWLEIGGSSAPSRLTTEARRAAHRAGTCSSPPCRAWPLPCLSP